MFNPSDRPDAGQAPATVAGPAVGPADGPLAGLRVIDWTHVLAGPLAAYQLGLLGADVLRIERADGDDMIRAKASDPALGALGLGETFVSQGSGKRSLAIDVHDPRAKQALAALIAGADVLVENFRPGTLARLGFDPADLVRRHPRLVVCSITGFGPGSDRRAYDHVVQAETGFMAANAGADGEPQRVGFPVVDCAVGQQAAQAVLAALLRRERQGSARTAGEWLQVSMAGAALTLLTPVYASALVSGIEPRRQASTAFSGSPLSGSFAAADGMLALVCNNAAQGRALVAMLAEAGAAPEAVALLERQAAEADVAGAQASLGRLLAARTVADWVARFGRFEVPVAPVRRAAQAASDAAMDSRQPWPQVLLPGRSAPVSVPGPGYASSLPLRPPAPLAPPPQRGADTRALLALAGLDDDTITGMLRDGVAWAPGAGS